jgi:hypothetical protein
MPLGIVSEEEFNKEFELIINDELINNLKSVNNSSKVEVKEIPHGRGVGNDNVPQSIRKLIGEESIMGSSAQELSESFGVSKSSISAYKKSATSTSSYRKPNQELLDHTNKVRDRITRKSRRLLLRAIDHITDDKLKDTKALELSSIAKNMGGIMKDMTPDINVNQVNNSVLIYMPRVKEEDEFEVIDVRD